MWSDSAREAARIARGCNEAKKAHYNKPHAHSIGNAIGSITGSMQGPSFGYGKTKIHGRGSGTYEVPGVTTSSKLFKGDIVKQGRAKPMKRYKGATRMIQKDLMVKDFAPDRQLV